MGHQGSCQGHYPNVLDEGWCTASLLGFQQATLGQVGQHADTQNIIPTGSNLFSTLFKVVKDVLNLHDEEVVTILGKRLDLKSGAGSNLEEFLQLDEACQALDELEKKRHSQQNRR